MSNQPLYIGLNKMVSFPEGGTGEFVTIKGETYYKIKGYNSMPTFFMTIVSSTDQWMFVASNGSLSAGRKNPESSLFPYYTDDKIIDSREVTGSKSIVKIFKEDKCLLWEPFTERYIGIYKVERNIYKNKMGNKVIFEEINLDLGFTFRYSWSFSNSHGFVKESELKNNTDTNTEVQVLDGLRNILPYGVDIDLQTSRSTLVDAYKKNELDKATGLGVFSLSSMIVDKAEPSEALKATTVWSKGLENTKFLLSTNQLRTYRRGQSLVSEDFTKASKAAYFVGAKFILPAQASKNWMIVSEVNQSNADVINLRSELESNPDIFEDILADIKKGSRSLKRLVALADGQQRGNDRLSTSRHFSNVMFNIMRGGIFENQYEIDTKDFANFLESINKNVFEKNRAYLMQLETTITYSQLLESAVHDSDLHRICLEYMPLSFSRRHGDPSRPWNHFNIDLYHSDGSKKYNYEGNWRDIFQNWEALAFSFPNYVFSMISKFVNASTIDGYNPYRISREGIDWEVIEPNDPWSYIGYWGDHQIIYLQKLLEHAENHFPGKLSEMLNERTYVYANVPYRIRGYEAIVKNPHDTIDFDHELAHCITQKTSDIGADGKLIWTNKTLLKSTFAEKLLIMALTKLYNFVPGGGIWLNTQRPEWNDANNALVGNGLSMVTTNYLRRFLVFAINLFEQQEQELSLHGATVKLLQDLNAIFEPVASLPQIQFTPQTRRVFINKLGEAGENYRNAAYRFFEEGSAPINSKEVVQFLKNALSLVEDTLNKGKRADGLYHSYNLLTLDKKSAKITYLYEMLEGQVAALSSGMLNPMEALNVLDELKESKMFRKDQYSYMLYPNKELKHFIEKNEIPKTLAKSSSLFKSLIENNDTSLIEKDIEGGWHFAGEIKNANDLKQILRKLKNTSLKSLVELEETMVLDAFEEVFNHVSFTGRSGTFYGYEGLGSIYWHMVSKLLLATQENILEAKKQNADTVTIGALKEHYYEIRAGIGINKSPKLYGAFPTDAYSHTPSNAGAQQPGMTGQVKEDIINRWAELGVEVRNGEIHINPVIFDSNELLDHHSNFEYYTNAGKFEIVPVSKGTLAFTYCGILVIYQKDKKSGIRVTLKNQTIYESEHLKLDAKTSAMVFSRTNEPIQITVFHPFSNQ